MNKQIYEITGTEAAAINERLIAFNDSRQPFLQSPPFIALNYGIKDEAGRVIAGILGVLYCWNCLSVEALWTDEDFRGRGLGTALMTRIESEARKSGALLSHLDTFDFQAKDFYERRGYTVFGVLDGCPPGRKRFYMRKTLS